MAEWTPDQAALVGDGRLSGDARTIGILVSLAGEDGLGYEELEPLFPDASRDRLRRAVTKLERCNWVVRKHGGRGHGDRIVFLAWAESATYAALRVAYLATLSDGLPETGKLRALSYPEFGDAKAPTTTIPLPPPPELSARAREAIDSSLVLRPCRDDLIAYLEAGRNPRPEAYARSVEGAISGSREELWRDRSGARILDGRAEIVAGVLQELAQSDEVGQYYPGPPGDFRNLAAKIRHRVMTISGAKSDGDRNRRADGRGTGGSRGDSGTGSAKSGGRRRPARVRVDG